MDISKCFHKFIFSFCLRHHWTNCICVMPLQHLLVVRKKGIKAECIMLHKLLSQLTRCYSFIYQNKHFYDILNGELFLPGYATCIEKKYYLCSSEINQILLNFYFPHNSSNSEWLSMFPPGRDRELLCALSNCYIPTLNTQLYTKFSRNGARLWVVN